VETIKDEVVRGASCCNPTSLPGTLGPIVIWVSHVFHFAIGLVNRGHASGKCGPWVPRGMAKKPRISGSRRLRESFAAEPDRFVERGAGVRGVERRREFSD